MNTHLKVRKKSKDASHRPHQSSVVHYRNPSQSAEHGAFYSAGPVLGISKKEVSIGKSGDKYEKEADAAAAKITSGQQAGTISRMEIKKPEVTIQTSKSREGSSTHGISKSDVASHAISNKGSGSSLSSSTQNVLESGFGAGFSNVKVHNDIRAHEAADALSARAFTHKSDIWLGKGESQDDMKLMAHEATHVVQQQAVIQRSPVVTPAPASIQRSWLSDARKLVGKATDVVGGAIGRGKDWALGKVSDLVVNIPGFFLLCVMLGRNPVTDKPVERNAINLIQGMLGLIPGGEKIFQNLQKSGAIEQVFKWLNDQVVKLNLTWESIKGLFNKVWDSLSATDVLGPSKAFEKVKTIFGPPLARIKDFAIAAGKKILEFIFEGVLKLAGPLGVQVLRIMKKAGDVFSTIINDPVGFVGNLIQSVRKGFNQFSDNILTHLKTGLMGWLFGALSEAGITLPEKFDIRGILSLVLQILGITYSKLRIKLVNVIGEKPVKYMETAFEFLYLIVTKGLGAAWEKLIDFIGDLKEIVLGAIQDWVVTTIVKKAIMKVVSMFNPAGAVIQAIIMVYDTVTFFIERMKQIMELAESVLDSIANIAAGKLDAAANYVEKTMARTLPVIIGFLASLIGLGGISEKIKKIIVSIQAKVDVALDKIVNFIVTKAKALFGKGKKAVGKLFEWWKQRKDIKIGNKKHTIQFEGKENNAELSISSSPLVRYKKYLVKIEDRMKSEKQKKAYAEALEVGAQIDKTIKIEKKSDDQKTSIGIDLDRMSKLLEIMLQKSDIPYEITWPKRPLREYLPFYLLPYKVDKPIPQTDIKNIKGSKEYKPTELESLPEKGDRIGVARRNQTTEGMIVGPKISGRSETEMKKFKKALKDFGYDRAEKDQTDADHIVELQMSGTDSFDNLWPLNSSENRSAGSTLVKTKVQTEDGEKKIKDMKGSFFKIKDFKK